MRACNDISGEKKKNELLQIFGWLERKKSVEEEGCVHVKQKKA